MSSFPNPDDLLVIDAGNKNYAVQNEKMQLKAVFVAHEPGIHVSQAIRNRLEGMPKALQQGASDLGLGAKVVIT